MDSRSIYLFICCAREPSNYCSILSPMDGVAFIHSVFYFFVMAQCKELVTAKRNPCEDRLCTAGCGVSSDICVGICR